MRTRYFTDSAWILMVAIYVGIVVLSYLITVGV